MRPADCKCTRRDLSKKGRKSRPVEGRSATSFARVSRLHEASQSSGGLCVCGEGEQKLLNCGPSSSASLEIVTITAIQWKARLFTHANDPKRGSGNRSTQAVAVQIGQTIKRAGKRGRESEKGVSERATRRTFLLLSSSLQLDCLRLCCIRKQGQGLLYFAAGGVEVCGAARGKGRSILYDLLFFC